MLALCNVLPLLKSIIVKTLPAVGKGAGEWIVSLGQCLLALADYLLCSLAKGFSLLKVGVLLLNVPAVRPKDPCQTTSPLSITLTDGPGDIEDELLSTVSDTTPSTSPTVDFSSDSDDEGSDLPITPGASFSPFFAFLSTITTTKVGPRYP